VKVTLQPLQFSISENFTMLSFSEKDSGSILHNAGWEHFAAWLDWLDWLDDQLT
jgi:hypothetical protein